MAAKNPSGRSRKPARVRKAGSSKPPSPEVSIEERPAGRDTLTAILREMRAPSSRKPFVTIGYDEKPLSDADLNPAKDESVPSCRDDPDTPPEVTVTETRPGFETMAIIDEELLRDARSLSRAQEQRRYVDAEVLELFTFVILDGGVERGKACVCRTEIVASVAAGRGGGDSSHRRAASG
jgi:hypothetical protein